MLKDLQVLENEVFDDRTRPLVTEVVKSYEAGALRAAIISLWVAVVADLTYKMKFLADTGDGDAKNKIVELENAISNKQIPKIQEFERTILDFSLNPLSIITSRDFEELRRLNDDRNLCAHPAFDSDSELYQPDAETVRAHIVMAGRAVFSQRPLAGKKLLELLQHEIVGASWPDLSDERNKDYLDERYLQKTREPVCNNIIRMLIKDCIHPHDDNELLAQRCREAIYVIAEKTPGKLEALCRGVLKTSEESGTFSDEQLVRATGAFGHYGMYWSNLPATARTRLHEVLTRHDFNFLEKNHLFSHGIPQDEEFAKIVREKLFELDRKQLETAIRQSDKVTAFVPAAISLVKKSETFRDAEANLYVLQSCSSDRKPREIEDLKEAILSNNYDQVRLAGGSESILISIFEDSHKSAKQQEEWKHLAHELNSKASECEDTRYTYKGLCDKVGVDAVN